MYRLSKPALLGYKTPTTHSLGQLLRNSPPNRDVYWSPGIHPYRDQLKLAFMANRNDYKVLMNPECSVLIGAYYTNRKGFMGTQTTTANCQSAHLVVMVVHTIGQAKYHKHQRLTRNSNNYVLCSRLFQLTVVSEIKQQQTIHKLSLDSALFRGNPELTVAPTLHTATQHFGEK